MITKKELDNFAKSPDLSSLEKLLNEPNIFNILKLETNELKHSNFLAWLLDPKGSHKLDDLFLKEFLKKVIPNLGNFEQLSFSDARIEREKNNIDILITDDSNNLLLVIENKIYSQETGDQLNKYKKYVEESYSNYDKHFVFLTANQMNPSNQSYIKITYDTIIEIIKKIKNEKPNKIIPYIIEYTKLLEREFMEESDISKLTKQIYSQHKKAITHLFDYVNKQELNEWVKDLIKKNNFILDNCKGKYFIRFIPKEMDLEEIKKGNPKDKSRWSDVDRIILFEFGVNCDRDNKIYLSLMMGPGDEELRQKLYSIVLMNKSIFAPSSSLQDDFCSLHDVFEIDKIDTKSIEELEEEIEQKFNEFLKNSLPKIVNAFKKEFKKED